MANIIEHLRFRAQIQPQAIAIQELDRATTFAEMFDCVRATAAKLRALGVRRGDVVATSFHDAKTHWVATLALFHEAAISCADDGDCDLHARVDRRWILADRLAPRFPPDRTILLDEAWFSNPPTCPTEVRERQFDDPGAPARLIFTSGSTGLRKAAVLSLETIERRALETRLHTDNWRYRSFMLMGFSTVAGFTHALACLISGTTLYCEDAWSEVPKLIETFAIECLDAAPAQLMSLIEIDGDRRRFRSLKLVKYVGAAMSASQLQRVREGLCENIMNLYGSTEVGHVALRPMTANGDPATPLGVVGRLFPGIHVEVLDDFGDPAPNGKPGRLRIKGRSMASGYYRDPDASAERFKDGWFHPGDIGYLANDGELAIVGRDSEMINRGGAKLSPVEIENLLADVAGVAECAAFKCLNRLGFEDIAVAFVLAGGFDFKAVQSAMRETIAAHRRPYAYVRVDKIPRNAMGKVMRGRLSEVFSDHILKQSARRGGSDAPGLRFTAPTPGDKSRPPRAAPKPRR